MMALSLLALVGAGCAKAPIPTETKTAAEAQTVSLNEDGTQTMTTDTGATLQIKTESAKPSIEIQTNDDDVPVTDIFLGEPQEKYTMEAVNFAFAPNVLNVKAGDAVQLTFTKVTGTHTFDIDETDSHYKISQGSVITFIAPKKPGNYKYYCGVGNHRQMGMEGTIIVK